jgi:hypothetical protein
MHYFAFVIPFLLCIFYKIKFKREVTFWEFALSLIMIPIIIALLVWGYIGVKGHDIKTISGYVVGKEYIPEHEEMRTRIVCTGSGKNQSCHAETYWVTIPDDWNIYVAHKKPTDFGKYPASYGGEKYGEADFWGIDVTSDFYYSIQIGKEAVWTDRYLNPLKFNENTLYRKIHDKKFPELKTPQIFNYIDMNRITLLNGLTLSKDWHSDLNKLNSDLLRTNINFGIIGTTYGSNFLEYLSNIWKGGNPNDFIVVICCDAQKNIRDCKIIAWDNEYLKIKVKDEILNSVKSLEEIDKILEIVNRNVRKIGFKEKDLSRFNYMKVELPVGFLVFLYLITAGGTIAILEYMRSNEFSEEE